MAPIGTPLQGPARYWLHRDGVGNRHNPTGGGMKIWKRGRVVYRSGLENPRGGNPTVSSNLTASARTNPGQPPQSPAPYTHRGFSSEASSITVQNMPCRYHDIDRARGAPANLGACAGHSRWGGMLGFMPSGPKPGAPAWRSGAGSIPTFHHTQQSPPCTAPWGLSFGPRPTIGPSVPGCRR